MRESARHPASVLLAVGLLVAGGVALADDAAESLYRLGVAYEHGEGVERDPALAAGLYCEAVWRGDVDAMHALGWMYAHGRGIARDDSIASTLFAMAAFLGHPQAARMLHHLGGHRGEVPPCLILPPADRASDFDRDRAFLIEYLERQPPERHQFVELIASLAPQYEIDPRLALAVASAESDFNPQALSNRMAMGLMQLIPDTAQRFNVRNARDPEQNVRGGLAYLRWLLSYFRGHVAFALAAYNAGERAVDRYRGVPPYRETRDYVARIRGLFPDERHAYRASIVEASPIVGRMAPGGDAAGAR